VLRQIERVSERIDRSRAGGYRREVEDGKEGRTHLLLTVTSLQSPALRRSAEHLVLPGFLMPYYFGFIG